MHCPCGSVLRKLSKDASIINSLTLATGSEAVLPDFLNTSVTDTPTAVRNPANNQHTMM